MFGADPNSRRTGTAPLSNPLADPPPPATRPAVVLAGAAVILAVGGWLLARFYADPEFLPPDDFLQYWAAGRLNATGGNPYDADQLLALQQTAGRDKDRAVVMWNPPWALTLAMPFGLLPPRTAQLVWLLAQVLSIAFCADRLWALYGGDRRLRPWVIAAALGFFPTMYVVFAGQSGGWLLLGLAGLLLAATRGPAWLAVLAPLAALKPHLFIPVWIVLALEAGRTRRGLAVLAWGVGCGLVAMAIPTLVNPDVWNQYLGALTRPVDDNHPPLSGWKSPLVGWWVRMAVAPEAFWVQAVPTALAAVAVPVYWWRRRAAWDWSVELPRLVLVGLIAAPYGAWPYDQVVMLVPLAAAAARLARHGTRGRWVVAGVVLGAINAVGLVIRDGEFFVWAPPAVLAWCAWVLTVGDTPRESPLLEDEETTARGAGELLSSEAAR
jgi:hypothetical protein